MTISLIHKPFKIYLQVGHIFVKRILFESWPVGMPTLLAFFYCSCQTSIEVKNYKIKNEILYGRDRND